METFKHLFFECVFAIELWFALGFYLKLDFSQRNNWHYATDVLHALLYVVDRNLDNFIVESDCKTLVDSINGHSDALHNIDSMNEEIQSMLPKFNHIIFSYVNREANKAANWAANLVRLQYALITLGTSCSKPKLPSPAGRPLKFNHENIRQVSVGYNRSSVLAGAAMLGLVKSCIGTKFTGQFGDLIAVDMVTPVCFQLTYEGLLDEIPLDNGICHGSFRSNIRLEHPVKQTISETSHDEEGKNVLEMVDEDEQSEPIYVEWESLRQQATTATRVQNAWREFFLNMCISSMIC
ncbi:hypothetical protein Cni_G19016 [Canna indica]|uniref:RNase H type-1 domain-containing protein n=1 Tax=Canna indica TaxID=4628 RepID=A0AAQ3KQJ7_9LILI|nr:hypothetical protein Cni_G19016 [Canna indica]